MPKIKLQASPEKIGSSTIIIEPNTAEAAVKKMGFNRVTHYDTGQRNHAYHRRSGKVDRGSVTFNRRGK